MTSTVCALSLGMGPIIYELRLSTLPCWTVLNLRQNRSQQRERLSGTTWHGKWQPTNLREHSEIAWSTGERAGKNAYSPSAHREHVLQLHRWWDTQVACAQGQQVSVVSRQQSRVRSISPLSPSEPANSTEAQHLILKGEPSRRQKRIKGRRWLAEVLNAKLPLCLSTNKAYKL